MNNKNINKKVLLLNQNYIPIMITGVKRAINLTEVDINFDNIGSAVVYKIDD